MTQEDSVVARIRMLIDVARAAVGKPPLERCDISTGAGWDPILEEMFTELIAAGWAGEIRQIKEKFGELTMYLTDISEETPELQAICRAAYRKAEQTCEFCGQPGEVRDLDWAKTLCDEHYDKRRRAKDIWDKTFKGVPGMKHPGEVYRVSYCSNETLECTVRLKSAGFSSKDEEKLPLATVEQIIKSQTETRPPTEDEEALHVMPNHQNYVDGFPI